MSHLPNEQAKRQYWAKSIRWTLFFLAIWFLASFGCGILFRPWLDANFPKVGHAPFGFWMAQQGSIITFVLILVAYSKVMGRLDRQLNK